jgi:hypothetical protein
MLYGNTVDDRAREKAEKERLAKIEAEKKLKEILSKGGEK